jgi:hypothetical protein
VPVNQGESPFNLAKMRLYAQLNGISTSTRLLVLAFATLALISATVGSYVAYNLIVTFLEFEHNRRPDSTEASDREQNLKYRSFDSTNN